MATILTVVIQALVVGGLIACIVVGTQDRSSPGVPPITEARYAGDLPPGVSAAAYPIVGHQAAGILSGAGETFILFSVGDGSPTPSQPA
ncbi:hypothetical protein L21_1897 [Methanoculleus chikugoensis]|jgi:hypothetical protein|uniref:Uncharacterized protein n=1 Tax=Methanoculleus chikugoensis TaxID=118126 RepID=A0A1M4MMA0_9EURY|nr:hypothetical protein [Methanoculleus chikugoensis]MDD4567012.1 hypothetical protein [Methanoculleus chikugoensis]NMA09532.1 hypothetical protein [Methanomicrobiales archaeon]SCL75977.1 hypothetical protein L21_1897 [Methanoculleus chikugoensis]